MYPVGAELAGSDQTIPESTSELGTASRRPKLPSESQPNCSRGAPCLATERSISLRTQRLDDHGEDLADPRGGKPPRCIATTVAVELVDDLA